MIQFAILSVLSSQNDAKLENDELATDLISTIKEFEETTAKITSVHSQQTNDQNHQTANKATESMLDSSAEKGPIEYFNRTKETLRHVEQTNHHNNDNNNSKMHEAATDHQKYGNDGNESDYVKIPVQQLINTFEKQMRSIIKQKINENIQLKLDDGSSANSNKKPVLYTAPNVPSKTTTTSTTAQQQAPIMNTIRDNYHCDIVENGKMNGNSYETESNQFTAYDPVYANRQTSNDIKSKTSQQHQTTTKQTECHEMTQSMIVESTNKRFSNSNEIHVESNFDGGKGRVIYSTSYPFLHHIHICSLVSQ